MMISLNALDRPFTHGVKLSHVNGSLTTFRK